MIPMIAGWLAKSVLMLSPVGGFIRGAGALARKVPWQVWAAIAAVALIVAGTVYHGHKAHQAIDAAEKRGADREATRIAAQAIEIKRKADALNAAIAATIRSRTDEENRRIARDADDLRLSGPSKARASCPVAATGAGGHVTASGSGDAAGSGMLAEDRAAVPWPWLVQRAEQADLNRGEVLAWREWYRKMEEAWPKSDATAASNASPSPPNR